jgi:hypothetical protein
MVLKRINTNHSDMNMSGPSPQVLVDVSHPERMKDLSTGVCLALFGAIIGIVMLILAYTDKSFGISPDAAWVACALFWPPAIILGIIYGVRRVRRLRARAQRWREERGSCVFCKQEYNSKEGAVINGNWYCHSCITDLHLLKNRQSVCPNCGAITEYRPGEVLGCKYYCHMCTAHVPPGKITATE